MGIEYLIGTIVIGKTPELECDWTIQGLIKTVVLLTLVNVFLHVR